MTPKSAPASGILKWCMVVFFIINDPSIWFGSGLKRRQKISQSRRRKRDASWGRCGLTRGSAIGSAGCCIAVEAVQELVDGPHDIGVARGSEGGEKIGNDIYNIGIVDGDGGCSGAGDRRKAVEDSPHV